MAFLIPVCYHLNIVVFRKMDREIHSRATCEAISGTANLQSVERDDAVYGLA